MSLKGNQRLIFSITGLVILFTGSFIYINKLQNQTNESLKKLEENTTILENRLIEIETELRNLSFLNNVHITQLNNEIKSLNHTIETLKLKYIQLEGNLSSKGIRNNFMKVCLPIDGDLRIDQKGITLSTGNSHSAYLEQHFEKPLNLEESHFVMNFFLDDPTTLNQIKILFESSNGKWNDYYATDIGPNLIDSRYYLKKGWNNITIVKPYCYTALGNPIWGSINNIRILVSSAENKNAIISFNDFKSFLDVNKGTIILRFDDNRLDTYTKAKPIMDKYCYPGVAAICTDWVKRPNNEKMNLEQIVDLYNCGWDIVSHGLNHLDFTKITRRELISQCYESKKWLIEHGFNRSANYIVLPFDSYNQDVLDTVKKYYISTCGTLFGYNSFSLIDPYNMHRIAVQRTSDWEWDVLKVYVDNTIKHKLLTIVLIHDIDQGTFETLIEYINKNNLKVITFSKLNSEIKNKLLDTTDLLMKKYSGDPYTLQSKSINGTHYILYLYDYL